MPKSEGIGLEAVWCVSMPSKAWNRPPLLRQLEALKDSTGQ